MPRYTLALAALAALVFVACGSPTTCDSSNCPGCCLAGVCSAGTTTSECGSRGNLCIACPLVQTDQADARQSRDTREARQRKRPSAVILVRLPLPADPDLEAVIAELLAQPLWGLL